MLTNQDKKWIANALLLVVNIVIYHFSCRDAEKNDMIKRLIESVEK